MRAIRIFDHAGSFAENKDIAAHIRDADLRPALTRGDNLQIDFVDVDGATQSFIHALISDLIRKVGPSVLDNLEFKNCNASVRSVIEIVVEYSQLEDSGVQEQKNAPASRSGKNVGHPRSKGSSRR